MRNRCVLGLVLVSLTLAVGTATAGATPAHFRIVSGTGAGTLESVSCPTTTFCAAVGIQGDGSQQTLIEMWDGTNWSPARTPPGPSVNGLTGVSCVNPTFCIAVGFLRRSATNRTLVEMWDGSTWSRVSSRNRGSHDSILSGVTCVSPTSCVAVGLYYKPPRQHTLVESWNGTSWSIVPSPNLPGPNRNDTLYGVSCATSTSCVAVGADTDAEGFGEPLVESWDGADWSIAATPDPGTFGQLNGISCPTPTSCVAVGLTNDGSNDFANLAETWDGASWTITNAPDLGTRLDELVSVSCTSATNCVAVGAFDARRSKVHTLVEAWDGSAWTVTPSQNTPTSENYLNATSCFDAGHCFAVGFSIDGSLILSGH